MAKDNWCSGSLREAPFYHDEITPEEYDKERLYLAEHWEDYKKGKYVPLWKQKKD